MSFNLPFLSEYHALVAAVLGETLVTAR